VNSEREIIIVRRKTAYKPPWHSVKKLSHYHNDEEWDILTVVPKEALDEARAEIERLRGEKKALEEKVKELEKARTSTFRLPDDYFNEPKEPEDGDG
jgi:BMFP domain-containing protein YqiC